MNSLEKLKIENNPMHPSAIYCLSHLKSAKACKPPKKPRKKQFKYADIFYDETLRSEILNKQNGNCLLKDDNCKGAMTFHHIDRDKTNNHVDNLAYMCTKHHFSVHNGTATLFN